MTDRAAQIAALLRETYKQNPGRYASDGVFGAVAAVLAPWCERVEALESRGKADYEIMHVPGLLREPMPSCQCRTCEALRKPNPAPVPVPQPGATRGAEVAARMAILTDGGNPKHAAIGLSPHDTDDQFVHLWPDSDYTPASTLEAMRKWIGDVIDAERAAARRDALAEAEGAVRAQQEPRETSGPLYNFGVNTAAAAVARLREGT